MVNGEPGSVSLYIGIWEPQESAAGPGASSKTLAAILNGVYPGIELDESVDIQKAVRKNFSAAGLALGIPTAKPPDLTDGAFAIDRLIRSLTGIAWQGLILAQPIPEGDIRNARTHLIAEMRSMQSAAKTSGSPSPLAEHYNRLLSIALEEFTNAQAVGAWRTAVYLMSAEESFGRLAGAWRGAFSGATSLPEPMRVWRFPDALGLADAWVMPNTEEIHGPGDYHHPYKYQTILSSSQIAAYIHLPQLETRGFTVKLVPGFDVVPSTPKSKLTISIGNVVDRTQPSDVPYLIPTTSLAGHVFVTGMTGTGKTNTLFHLLREAFAQGIKFLVIEPAKREYRALLEDDVVGEALESSLRELSMNRP